MASKWADIRSKDQSAREFARDVLRARVQAVVELLPLAAFRHVEDVEHVHRLRVSSRRARAALDVFEPLVEGKISALKKWLRRTRRAAGPARDTDVLIDRFGQEKISPELRDLILDRLFKQRAEAQIPLVELADTAHPRKLQELLDGDFQIFDGDGSEADTTTARAYGRQVLKQVSEEFLQFAQMAEPSLEEMHEIRIFGKRLRYSIEIFHSAFDDDLRDKIYPMLTLMQDRLGKINDHVTAQKLFQEWLVEMEPDDLAAQLAYQIVEEHDEASHLRQEYLGSGGTKRLRRLRRALRSL